jgi:hypothetical protein
MCDSACVRVHVNVSEQTGHENNLLRLGLAGALEQMMVPDVAVHTLGRAGRWGKGHSQQAAQMLIAG